MIEGLNVDLTFSTYSHNVNFIEHNITFHLVFHPNMERKTEEVTFILWLLKTITVSSLTMKQGYHYDILNNAISRLIEENFSLDIIFSLKYLVNISSFSMRSSHVFKLKQFYWYI